MILDPEHGLHPSTAVVSLGRPPSETDAPLNPPLVLSSTYVGSGAPGGDERGYARFSNPTWDPLEEAIAALEGSSVPALAYASGMAAVAAGFSLVPVGGTAVVPTTSYNGTIGLARRLDESGAIRLREVDATDPDAVIAALDGAALLWLESPTNPLLDVIDVPRLAVAARERGALVAVDNTFSTPLRQRPLELGADLVVHSGTKFIAGHSDVLLGLVVTREPALRGRLLTQRTLHGAIPGPFEAWLALRGLRTLALRLDRAESSAADLAERLLGAPGVARVRYPGLGAIVSIELEGGAAHADAFVRALRLFTPATSLGGVESLAERRRRHAGEPVQVPEALVRLSVGIEHVEDLWADLSQALEAAARS